MNLAIATAVLPAQAPIPCIDCAASGQAHSVRNWSSFRINVLLPSGGALFHTLGALQQGEEIRAAKSLAAASGMVLLYKCHRASAMRPRA